MKMKKFIAIACLSILGVAFAQNPTKVGVVDADAVVQQSTRGKAFLETYRQFNEKQRDELKAFYEEFQAKQKDAQTKAASLSDAKKRELGSELQRMQTELRRRDEDAKSASENMLNSKLEEYRKELAPLIREVAQEMSLDLVFNFGPNSNLVYYHEKIDITPMVIKKFDENKK